MDWRWLASCSSLLVLVGLFICCFRLPTSLAAGSDPQNIAQPCKPKSVLVDIKDNTKTYDIPYSVCVDQNPSCYLSESNDECDDSEISEALLYMGDSGTVQKLPHDDQTFNVTLQGENFMMTGVNNWIVSYKYETKCDIYPFRECCTCQVNLSLTIVIDDLELNLDDDSRVTMLSLGGAERKFQVKEITTDDNSVILNCSSGLQDQLTPLRFKFVFSTTLQDRLSINEEYNKTAWCNETSDGTIPYPNWKITRQGDACILHLKEFSQADNGTYGCILYYPDSNSHYGNDLSNTIQLIAPSDTKLASFGIIFVVGLTIGSLFVFFILSAVSVYALHSTYCKRSPTIQHQRLVVDRDGDYGTIPQNPGSNLSSHASSPNVLVLDSQTSRHEVENPPEEVTVLSDDDQQTQQPAANPVTQTEPKRGRKPSADSERADISLKGNLSDDALTTWARVGDKATPPCFHRGACCKSLICQHCKKAYCIHQQNYFDRHEMICNCDHGATNGSESGSHSSASSMDGSGEQQLQ